MLIDGHDARDGGRRSHRRRKSEMRFDEGLERLGGRRPLGVIAVENLRRRLLRNGIGKCLAVRKNPRGLNRDEEILELGLRRRGHRWRDRVVSGDRVPGGNRLRLCDRERRGNRERPAEKGREGKVPGAPRSHGAAADAAEYGLRA